MIPELPESPTLSRQRRVTMGETNDEREGSRAAHPPPRLYPESPFPEAFCFLFFRSTKRRILLPRYREGKMDLLHSDDCLVCFSAFSSQMSSLVFFGIFLGLFLSDCSATVVPGIVSVFVLSFPLIRLQSQILVWIYEAVASDVGNDFTCFSFSSPPLRAHDCYYFFFLDQLV